MIIHLGGKTPQDVEAACGQLVALAQVWGVDATWSSAEVSQTGSDGKVADPVSIAALVVSLPSAALAAADLTDRIRKRRRAHELVDLAAQLASQEVTLRLRSERSDIQIARLDPDRLLDAAHTEADA